MPALPNWNCAKSYGILQAFLPVVKLTFKVLFIANSLGRLRGCYLAAWCKLGGLMWYLCLLQAHRSRRHLLTPFSLFPFPFCHCFLFLSLFISRRPWSFHFSVPFLNISHVTYIYQRFFLTSGPLFQVFTFSCDFFPIFATEFSKRRGFWICLFNTYIPVCLALVCIYISCAISAEIV
jgi:hypothetical protein